MCVICSKFVARWTWGKAVGNVIRLLSGGTRDFFLFSKSSRPALGSTHHHHHLRVFPNWNIGPPQSISRLHIYLPGS